MLYDYKSDEIVQDVILDDLSLIYEDIADEFCTLRRGDAISIYVPSNVARDILGNILEYVDDVFVHADSHNELLYSDENEVIITIGYDGMIFVENARGNENRLIADDEDVIKYVHDSFSSKDVEYLSKDDGSVLVFGTKEEPIEKAKNSGITITVNGEEITDENEIRKYLLDYCEWMDEVNEFARLFNWL